MATTKPPPEDSGSDTAGDSDTAPEEATPEPRTGLPDWVWAPALTAAIAVLLLLVGAGTIVA